MTPITFVTGNQKKADFLAAYLGYPVEHEKIDLDELQSLDLKEIVSHKVRQAYEKVHTPVLVEDVSLEFKALGRLPGTYIRWFLEEISPEGLCTLLDNKDRSAVARCMLGYYDGTEEAYFEGSLEGHIALHPAGAGGFGIRGWDSIFIPEGYDHTRGEMGPEDERKTHLILKPFAQVKEFLAKRT